VVVVALVLAFTGFVVAVVVIERSREKRVMQKETIREGGRVS